MKANILALLAAFAFALGNVLQQKGTLETPAKADDLRFLGQIFRRPVWVAGAACQGSGWVLQAVALDTGSLIVVQSLTTMSLVIALPLGKRFTDQVVSRRVWLGAGAMVVGIILFLSVGAPTGGTSTPPASAWWSAGLSTIVFVAVLGGVGRRHQGATKALLFGSAAGVAFALQSAVTKLFVTVVGLGFSAVLSSWTIYVLIASAVVGFVLQQSALKTGVLAPAMASSNAVTLFGSVAFGATVFGESLSSGGARTAPAVIGLGVALLGIVLLAGAKPPQASEGVPRFDQIPTVDGNQGSGGGNGRSR
jgi:drug/metabolite transporter (DMT)-like permease